MGKILKVVSVALGVLLAFYFVLIGCSEGGIAGFLIVLIGVLSTAFGLSLYYGIGEILCNLDNISYRLDNIESKLYLMNKAGENKEEGSGAEEVSNGRASLSALAAKTVEKEGNGDTWRCADCGKSNPRSSRICKDCGKEH